MERIRNENISGTAKVEQFGDKIGETRLRCFSHVEMKDSGYTGQRMSKMKRPGRREKWKPTDKIYKCCKEDMHRARVTEEDVRVR